MATFLTGTQRLVDECLGAGSSARPTAVTGQVGRLKNMVQWYASAWVDIQSRHDNWRWMRKGFTFNTVAGTDTYAYGAVTDVATSVAITRFSRWWADDFEDPFKCYLQSAGVGGENFLIWIPWENFKYLYKRGTQNNGQPLHVSVDNDMQLVLGPKPDAVYVITGDYQRSPQVLAADGDTPEMPAQFHDLIWRRAMEMYGAHLAAPDAFQRAVHEGKRTLRALENNQLPKVWRAPPLA